MFGKNFNMNEQTMEVVREIGKQMPGGFFIYSDDEKDNEKLIYANKAVFDMFGCKDEEEFEKLTGNTFKGMVFEEDYIRITDSIHKQIKENEEKIDHVEYRIKRKDGAIRWVDDYGHYVENDIFGGLYYVFISDITEKKKEIESDNAKKEAVISSLMGQVENAANLANLMGSVTSLLSNMPALSFSKDAQTGVYLACNQAFAEYAHKSSPEEVIGLTDHEIFDKETADHFVDDDKKAIEMDEPYIFFEDVPDAGGTHIRNLQTTKLKFVDTNGRLCTLGMCVDVTEMTKIKSKEIGRASCRGRE